MVPWPLAGWSDPASVATLLVVRVACNVALCLLVASADGTRARSTIAAVTLTGCSAVLMTVVVGGTFGRPAGLLDIGVQVVLLVLAGYATCSSSARWRTLAFGSAALSTIALLLLSIVLYGEATVAP
ncbi:hypothetical protein [Halarchaeum salinum]|uniref:Uncharacterized protein n=1 Tax=Halarchaeum salinum TaxID=489912 RepID=A0AAV3S7F7_9EURY